MKLLPLRLVLLALAAMVSACVPTNLVQAPRVSVHVADADTGKRIVGARATYPDFPEVFGKTGADGEIEMPRISRWHVMVLGTDMQPVRVLRVQAPGFQEAEIGVYLGGPSTYTIKLKPLAH